jgi:hypothetical protein
MLVLFLFRVVRARGVICRDFPQGLAVGSYLFYADDVAARDLKAVGNFSAGVSVGKSVFS